MLTLACVCYYDAQLIPARWRQGRYTAVILLPDTGTVRPFANVTPVFYLVCGHHGVRPGCFEYV